MSGWSVCTSPDMASFAHLHCDGLTEEEKQKVSIAFYVLLEDHGKLRSLTHFAKQLVEDAVKTRHSSGLILEGILCLLRHDRRAFHYFHQYEIQGLVHPLAYYYMARAYEDLCGEKTKALRYYEKALGGAL